MPGNSPSPYALCRVDDVKDLLGYEEDDVDREDAIQRAINSITVAVRKRSQREFVSTDAEKDKTRFVLISQTDVDRGFVRVGDMQEQPSEIKMWTPDRDTSFDYDPEVDVWLLPDTPDPGFPFEYIKVKASAAPPLFAGNWLSVKTTWGFSEVPDDIFQVAIGASALWVLNDIGKLTELARREGRKVSLDSLIPGEFLDTVDEYRLYRVA